MNMQTRQDHKFWPFSRGLEIDINNFIGRLPQTVDDVLVKFRCLHNQNQEKTSRQSSLADAAKEVSVQTQQWWVKAGYKVRRVDDILQEIIKLDKTWKQLCRWTITKC